MKQRYLYPLIYCIPALLIALIICVLLGGAIGGILWIYVWGDVMWPRGVNTIFSAVMMFMFLAIWLALLIAAYNVGKAHESQPKWSSQRAVFRGVAVTVILLMMIGLRQWQLGNAGRQIASGVCADYCGEHGYSGSRVMAQNAANASCECLNAQGAVVIKNSIADLRGR